MPSLTVILPSRPTRLFFALIGFLLFSPATFAKPWASAMTPPDSTNSHLPAPDLVANREAGSAAHLLISEDTTAGKSTNEANAIAPEITLATPADSGRVRRADRPRISEYTVEPGVTYHYDKPKPLRWALRIPRDLGQFPGYAFQKDHTSTLIELVVGSAVLWVADQAIVDWSQDVGKQLGLTAKSTQKSLFSIPFHIGTANLPLELNVPDNLNSTFYYIGDGWTHLTIATSFWVYGGIKKDNRALQTSSQLGEAIFSTGLIIQGLKRITGRQSPYVATKDRGEWHLFPAYSRYQSFVPNYDAFPTGHLATAMATLTVIAENYPEYHFIRPMGYGLMGLLGYAMLNNGVHWASDYPIGIAIGYAFGHLAVRNGRTRVASADAPTPGSTGAVPLQPKPWYKQGKLSPFAYGPYTGASMSWSL